MSKKFVVSLRGKKTSLQSDQSESALAYLNKSRQISTSEACEESIFNDDTRVLELSNSKEQVFPIFGNRPFSHI